MDEVGAEKQQTHAHTLTLHRLKCVVVHLGSKQHTLFSIPASPCSISYVHGFFLPMPNTLWGYVYKVAAKVILLSDYHYKYKAK